MRFGDRIVIYTRKTRGKGILTALYGPYLGNMGFWKDSLPLLLFVMSELRKNRPLSDKLNTLVYYKGRYKPE